MRVDVLEMGGYRVSRCDQRLGLGAVDAVGVDRLCRDENLKEEENMVDTVMQDERGVNGKRWMSQWWSKISARKT